METITIHNESEFSPLEIIEYAEKKLMEQGRKSLNRTMCAYRGDDGMKCAFGFFIPDNDYNEDMEGRCVTHLIIDNCIGELKHSILFAAIQEIHDCFDVEFWPERFAKLKKEVLDFPGIYGIV